MANYAISFYLACSPSHVRVLSRPPEIPHWLLRISPASALSLAALIAGGCITGVNPNYEAGLGSGEVGEVGET
ncbi:hypothetical protein, partial [Enhygromyxa salina]|uniref:hypothetical protein n=1 Tax=Enhygromyxa salina TaxID=215803 RepID=UPI0011B277A9